MSDGTVVDLGYGPDQQALADAVAGWAARHATDAAVRETHDAMPWTLWSGLAELGVLGLGTEAGGGGAQEIAAVMEVLGAVACPGPLVAGFMANQLLDGGPAGDVLDDLAAGKAVVAVGTPPLVPWAPVAETFVELDADGTAAWVARVAAGGEVEAVETLGGEPWGRIALDRGAAIDGDRVDRAVTLGDIAVAAYLAGAAQQLVTLTAEWAADRKQFGKSIGEFQSVSHPLVDNHIRTGAARSLARMAAYAWDDRGSSDGGRSQAAAARLSATRAAVDATYRGHQAFGALGYTVEGPVAVLGQRIRQVSLHPPGPTAARRRALSQHGI